MRKLTIALLLATTGAPTAAQNYNVLVWDATPEFGGQAPNAQRAEFASYLNLFGGGGQFTATYVAGDTPGTLATQLASNSYDVVFLDSTNNFSQFGNQYFNAADQAAIRTFYASGNSNLLLDGTTYIRSINFDPRSNFPGANNSSGGLLVNEMFALGSRGGGIMFGTDHNCCQGDINYMLQAILPGAAFTGFTTPTVDGQFNGTELLNVRQAVAANDIFLHWDSIESQAVAPTGAFVDFLGNAVTLSSQVDVADVIGGPRSSYMSSSFAPGGGVVIITDPDPPGPVIPEPETWAMLVTGFGLVGAGLRRRRRAAVA